MASTRKTTVPLSLPLKTRIKLSIISTFTDASLCINGAVFNRRIINFFNIKVSANPNPVEGVISADVTVDPSRKLWFRIYVPTKSSTTNDHIHLPVIVFFHGGGFVYLSADNYVYDAFCRRLTSNVPAVVVSVDYRLAPEHRYPASYEDGFDVLKFLDEDEDIRQLLPGNADLSRCFLAGDSAGGNLAHNVAVKACQSKFRQLKVIGVVAIQPFFGGEERTEAEIRLKRKPLVSIKRTDWMWRALLPPKQGLNRDHQVINVSGPNVIDISRLAFPATLVVIAGHDPLQDWQWRYYQWLKRSGKQAYLVEYPNMCHAFYLFPEVTESGKLISDVAHFIHKCFNVE